jgi:hypothetical protein
VRAFNHALVDCGICFFAPARLVRRLRRGSHDRWTAPRRSSPARGRPCAARSRPGSTPRGSGPT